MVRFGIPGQNVNGLAYADDRLSTVPMVQAPRRPTVNDKKFPMWTEWRVTKNAVLPAVEGEFWKLIRFESNGDATWVMIGGGSTGPAVNFETDDGSPNVVPDGLGEIRILGGVGINVTGQGPGNTITIALTGGGAAIDTLTGDSGGAVSADGSGNINIVGGTGVNVSGDIGTNTLTINLTGGGIAIDQIDVDFASGSGTDPVVPDGSGQISVKGNTVTNGTNANAPVATHSRNANEYQIDVQLATTLGSAPADPFDVGLSSFDSVYHTITANGFVSLQERLLQSPIGTTLNLGISYSSPTFTIHGSDGTSLSSTNPAWVVMPDNANIGQKKVFQVTNNYSFDDDSGTSDISGNTFGTTSGVAWGQIMPFWIYFVVNDANDAVTPMLSRNHGAYISTSAPNIGKPSSSIADDEGAFWALDDAITVADYASNPCIRVGTFRMIKNDAANDDWTVQALNSKDGIGRTNFGVAFTMATLQNGATSGYLSSSNGGDTLPTFANTGYLYTMLEDGLVEINFSTTHINNTPSGTGNLRVHTPYVIREGSWKRNNAGFSFDDSSLANATVCGSIYTFNTTSNFISVKDFQPFGTATNFLTPGTLASGDGNFNWNLIYRAFYE